ESGFLGPVNQKFDIGKFSRTQAAAAAQAKYRDGYAGAPPTDIHKMNKSIVQYGKLVIAGIIMQQAVVEILVPDKLLTLFIINSIFICNRKSVCKEIEACCPPVVFHAHPYRPGSIPFSE